MRNKALFEKLAAAERKFFGADFFSPVLKGKPVRVRIEGIIVTLKIRPNDFEGWGVFKATSQQEARLKREPTMPEKRLYLDCFPRFSLVVCRQGDRILGVPANQGDGRIKIQGQVPISLPHEVRLFDTVDVRWDGENFWYDRPSTFRSPKSANQLRDLFTEETDPEKVDFPGLTAEEKLAYQLAFLFEIESKKDREEEKIKMALERAGGVYRSYVQRGDTYTVEFDVDGERHRSTVDRNTLSVVTAGICLVDHDTGVAHDSDFDLQSLVSVIREGQGRHLIYRR